MQKKYLVQLFPFYEADFLKEFGEIFYQADSISNVVGVAAELDLMEILKTDKRVRFVRDWYNFSFDI